MPRKSGLLEIVEQRQGALTAERAALKRERDALAAEAKALDLSLRTEVRSAVTDGATDGVQAVQTATEPLLGKLEGVVALADREHLPLQP